MKTQAWGWLAVAVLAAGLNASYHDGGLQWAHQVVDRVSQDSEFVLALASGRADQLITEARIVASQNEVPAHLSTSFQQVDTQIASSEQNFDRFEAMSDREQARAQAQLDRFEANRARIEARIARMRIPAADFNPVAPAMTRISICPRMHVNVSRIPVVKMPVVKIPVVQTPAVPVIHIETVSTGSL